MIILAIETSCDDTCIAILKINKLLASESKKPAVRERQKVHHSPTAKTERVCFEILSNIVSSQTNIHKKYGGIWPFLAKREHRKNLPIVLKKSLRQAQGKQKFEKPDLIAVTIGPGLEPCLWVGINFAKELAEKMKIPIIPVNHIEAHIAANFIGGNSKFEIRNSKLFPAICLVVSGGHTQLILMKEFSKYKILGETRDDAAGECLDKTARILGLGYPGGPAIAAEAAKLKTKNYNERNTRYIGRTARYKLITKLPRPMIYQKNYDFSFSGLKTAVLYNYKNQPEKIRKSKRYIQEMSFEIQQAVIDVLISKTLKAAKEFKAKSIILGGGVVANKELRKQFNKEIKKDLPNIPGRLRADSPKVCYLTPNIKFCTDNAAMIAVAAYYSRFNEKIKTQMKIEADANLRL